MSREPVGGMRGTFGEWGPDKAIASADSALARLASLGVEVPANSRLARARDLIVRYERLHVQLGPGDPDTEFALAEANKTIVEQHLIAFNLHKVTDVAAKKLGIMLGGEDVPPEKGDDHARDEQAEFFAGAVLAAAGYHVEIAEPDLIIERDQARLGVAVKRVKSDRQFFDRVRDAEYQLVRAKMLGLIVVNPEMFLIRRYRADNTADLSAAMFAKTDEWADSVNKRGAFPHVQAVIGLATSFRRASNSGGRVFAVGLHFHTQFVTEDSPDAAAQVRVVGERMGRALVDRFTRAMS